MQGSPWAIGLFALYAVATAWLAWRGGRQVGDSNASYAIGDGKMSPWMAGLTLGASLASSSTFVIVPGFVYAEGLPALIGFTLPFVGGIAAGLLLLAPAFQRVGKASNALTLPHWLGERYQSLGLRRLFAGLNVLSVAYLILITVGCGYVMQAALGVPYEYAVVGIVLFVFGYTGFGGAVAHAFTNSMQGAVMLVIALLIFGSGLGFWADGQVVSALADDGLTAPGSVLFSTAAEVWFIPFIMGFALTTQPHLLTKALYVDGPGALRKTLAIGIGTFAVFCLVLFAGVYAVLTLPADIPQDQVMARYLQVAFEWDVLGALASVAILAASMSTLDGLLVAISASVAGDVMPGRGSVALNRTVLALLAAATIAASLSPPKLVLILGQLGVYGLVAAGAGPLIAGMMARGRPDARWAFASAFVALAVHFGLSLGELTTNPGVSAAAALFAGIPVALVGARRAVGAAVTDDALAVSTPR
jgi:sodium/pantothenate symporter